jgi:hypothetical protein
MHSQQASSDLVQACLTYHYDAVRAHLLTHPHILITSAPLQHTLHAPSFV